MIWVFWSIPFLGHLNMGCRRIILVKTDQGVIPSCSMVQSSFLFVHVESHVETLFRIRGLEST